MHDSWTTGAGLGPGTATYESQLRQENAAFGTFFAGLAAHGITKANTLFVITADEGDHFVGCAPTPANCNGVTVPCTYSKVGEVDGNLTGMLGRQGRHHAVRRGGGLRADRLRARPAGPHRRAGPHPGADRGHGSPPTTWPPARRSRLTNYLADPVEMKLLHMVTGDPKRTPTVALFGNPDFWLSSGSASCGTSCVSEPAGRTRGTTATSRRRSTRPGSAWSAPAWRTSGVDSSIWSDHTDIQPTMMALLGLHDDYTPDGRVLAEVIDADGAAARHADQLPALLQLGQVYTQLDAAVGRFGLDTLTRLHQGAGQRLARRRHLHRASRTS